MRPTAQVTALGSITSMIVAVSTRPNRQNRSTCSRMAPLSTKAKVEAGKSVTRSFHSSALIGSSLMPYTASTLTLSSNMPRVRWNGESIFFVLLLLGLLSGLWVLGYLRERAAARELGRLDDEEAVWRGLAQLFLTLCAMTALGVIGVYVFR